MATPVTTVRSGPILEITIDRPPVNAINASVSSALHAAFELLRDDPGLRVGILTGGGEKAFSAGWDLKEVAQQTDPGETNDQAMDRPGGFGGITEFWDRKKPVIAAVNGVAVGGGFELALACDVILAADHAAFWLPEMQRGFVPDAGAVQKLPRLIPYNVAMGMMLTGRRMPASEAAHWGLAYQTVAAAKLMPTARELAATIAEGAPLAIEALLEAVPALMPLSVRDAFAKMKRGRSGLPAYEKTLVSEDFLEGPRAFAERRKPVWKGR